MLHTALTESLWLGSLVWACLYISDYCLTISGARLYQAQDKIVFQGSYEITPIFQADVNALRRISPRFIAILFGSTLYLLGFSYLSAMWEMRLAYTTALGALVLMEFTVHIRHLRNRYLFRHAFGPDGIRGRLEYPRGLILRGSALEVLLFGALYTLLFVQTGDSFVLGGALGCAVLAVNHYRLARRFEKAKLLNPPGQVQIEPRHDR